MKGKQFSNIVYENLPEVINNLMQEREEGPRRDAFLLSVLVSLGAAFYNVKGEYASETLRPSLMALIIAPPASGKSDVKDGPFLVSEIDKISKSIYNKVVKSNEVNENSSGKINSLFLPGNISYAALIEHLLENSEIGFMFETEADSLSKMFSKEWGDYSDALRKVYHHETISFKRKGHPINVINHPILSILLTGTPNQIKPLVESSENGIFSRFCFYYMESSEDWKDCNPKNHYFKKNNLTETQKLVTQLWRVIEAKKPIFQMEDEMWDYHTDFFKYHTENIIKVDKDSDYQSVLRRLGSMTFRFAMILSISDYLNKPSETPSIIKCSFNYLNCATKMVESLLFNAIEISTYLKNEKKHNFQNKMKTKLLESIEPGKILKRKDIIESAASLSLSERTIDGYLKEFIDNGLIEQEKIGNYQKKE